METKSVIKKIPKRGNYNYESNETIIVCNDKISRIGFFCLGNDREKMVYSVVAVDFVKTA